MKQVGRPRSVLSMLSDVGMGTKAALKSRKMELNSCVLIEKAVLIVGDDEWEGITVCQAHVESRWHGQIVLNSCGVDHITRGTQRRGVMTPQTAGFPWADRWSCVATGIVAN
jgi:hypothetical protein